MNDALTLLDGEFSSLYAAEGRPSIAPEKLQRAPLLQAFCSVRSEHQLMEQLDYNLLFRCLVGLGVDELVWVPTVCTKGRDRLLGAEVAAKFMAAVLAHREVKLHLSNDHFSVDGTLVEAWASFKSFRAKDGSDAALKLVTSMIGKLVKYISIGRAEASCRLGPSVAGHRSRDRTGSGCCSAPATKRAVKSSPPIIFGRTNHGRSRRWRV